MGWQQVGVRLRRRLGDREHARGALRRDAAQGGLRHDRLAHARALLRRLGLHAGRRGRRATRPSPATGRACRWAATCATRRQGKAPTFLVARAEGPDRRQPRPHPDRQGLGRRRRRAPGEGLRRRLVGRPQARRRRQAAAGRQHRGRRQRDLDEHDRRLRADRGLDGPGLRPEPARRLLRPRRRDPDAALDRLRRQALRHHDAEGGADVRPGAGLHLADLVHAGG